MRVVIQYVLLIVYVRTTESSIYSDLKENVLSLFDSRKYYDYDKTLTDNEDLSHNDVAKVKLKFQPLTDTLHKRNEVKFKNQIKKMPRKGYKLNLIMNTLKRRYASSSDTESSSREIKDWKEEWRDSWIKRKIEAINMTTPRGDVVNMVAARPWSSNCGDPNQHDLPWGTCTLSAECEPEFRIYRGDYFCGRAPFVCCGIIDTAYDLYQGFDVSFADSTLETDSEERKRRGGSSKERRRRRKRRARKLRRRNRKRRKKKIKKKIRKTVTQIKKLLNRAYKNGTAKRKKKTRYLKKFIKKLKKQFKKDRQSVKNIHEIEMIKIDSQLQKKLIQMLSVNHDFMKNDTYRDLIINGTISKKIARTLAENYPELSSAFDLTRRSAPHAHSSDSDLNYDIEYGLLYY